MSTTLFTTQTTTDNLTGSPEGSQAWMIDASLGSPTDLNNGVSSPAADQSVFPNTQDLSNTNSVSNNQPTDPISLGLLILGLLAPPIIGGNTTNDTLNSIAQSIYATLVGAVFGGLIAGQNNTTSTNN